MDPMLQRLGDVTIQKVEKHDSKAPPQNDHNAVEKEKKSDDERVEMNLNDGVNSDEMQGIKRSFKEMPGPSHKKQKHDDSGDKFRDNSHTCSENELSDYDSECDTDSESEINVNKLTHRQHETHDSDDESQEEPNNDYFNKLVQNVDKSAIKLEVDAKEDDFDFDIKEKLKEMGEITFETVKKGDSKPKKPEELEVDVSVTPAKKGDEESKEGSKETERKGNMRRNIREVMDETKLEESTLAAQRQEMERLRRVQEQQRLIREVQRQMAQDRVISLLQGNNVPKPGPSGGKHGNTVLVKMPNGQTKPMTKLPRKPLELMRIPKDAVPPNQKPIPIRKPFPAQGNIIPSVSIAPVGKRPVSRQPSDSDSDEEYMNKQSSIVKPKPVDTKEAPPVQTIDISSDDDCIVVSDPEAEDEEVETPEDPTNSGMHTNDEFNQPDDQGRVVINIGHPDDETDLYLAPQIARIIKPHQIGGIRFLYDNIIESTNRFDSSTGFGCILAHSMGLGKTLQVVTFTDIFLRHTSAKTILCIMPINTLQNWLAEYNMWLPTEDDASKSSLLVHGEVRPRNFNLHVLNDSHKTLVSRAKVIHEWKTAGGVLLIGYEQYRLLSLRKHPKSRSKNPETIKADDDKNKLLFDDVHEALVKPGPDLVICDEGHRIKNSHASISQALKQMVTKRRVVLTGYPLQNNLMEYWCMVDFVRPNYLGTKSEFCNMFERPIQNGQCIDSTEADIKLMRYRAHVLHSLLLGFVQRRSHRVLQTALPQKEEYVLLLRMTPFQRTLYETFMNEVVRSQTVPNPLKAFAVCCKIWNHPDVLYYFLKKQAKGDAVDIDLEEVSTTSSEPSKMTKSRTKKPPKGKKSKPAASVTPYNTNINPESSTNNIPNASPAGNNFVNPTINQNQQFQHNQSNMNTNFPNNSGNNANTQFQNSQQQNFNNQQPYRNFANFSNTNYNNEQNETFPAENRSFTSNSAFNFVDYGQNYQNSQQSTNYPNVSQQSFSNQPNYQQKPNFMQNTQFHQDSFSQNPNFTPNSSYNTQGTSYPNNSNQQNYPNQSYWNTQDVKRPNESMYNYNGHYNQNQMYDQNKQWIKKEEPSPIKNENLDMKPKINIISDIKINNPFEQASPEKKINILSDLKLECKKEPLDFKDAELMKIKSELKPDVKIEPNKADDDDDDVKIIGDTANVKHSSGKEDASIPYDWAIELLKDYVPGCIENSAKMEILFCIIKESLILGDRLLVFSQSLITLDLIEQFLQMNVVPGDTQHWAKNTNYYRLDGSTSALDREKLINEFNSNPKIYLFLVSTRAGSLGINLIGANRVVVFDASWNPCHDTQAVCRVYRYGQRKPCFVYRLVVDNCLEKKIYDRQINKQGMSDRVVDECNPDAHLTMKDVSTLCWDDEQETPEQDWSHTKESYIDVVLQKVLVQHGRRFNKEPFQHESLLIDRKDKQLSKQEKRLAKKGYEREKQAARQPSYGITSYMRGRPVASVRPMQQANERPSRWIPAEHWQRQGMTAQEMTLPLDVVIPTNQPDKSNIVLKAGQKVLVLKSPKGVYMQLESGKIVAIKTAIKVRGKIDEDVNKVQTTNIPPTIKNNSALSVIPQKRVVKPFTQGAPKLNVRSVKQAVPNLVSHIQKVSRKTDLAKGKPYQVGTEIAKSVRNANEDGAYPISSSEDERTSDPITSPYRNDLRGNFSKSHGFKSESDENEINKSEEDSQGSSRNEHHLQHSFRNTHMTSNPSSALQQLEQSTSAIISESKQPFQETLNSITNSYQEDKLNDDRTNPSTMLNQQPIQIEDDSPNEAEETYDPIHQQQQQQPSQSHHQPRQQQQQSQKQQHPQTEQQHTVSQPMKANIPAPEYNYNNYYNYNAMQSYPPPQPQAYQYPAYDMNMYPQQQQSYNYGMYPPQGYPPQPQYVPPPPSQAYDYTQTVPPPQPIYPGYHYPPQQYTQHQPMYPAANATPAQPPSNPAPQAVSYPDYQYATTTPVAQSYYPPQT